ncbi:MAG: caspase family protein [Campylobacterota bacterium]|nr:caspase family protein [Campylobacterota bacterium]
MKQITKLLIVSLFILFTINSSLLATNSEAILKLNIRGHLTDITDAILTSNGDIISSSNDGIILIWNKDGNIKKKILAFNTKDKTVGINSLAISHDNRFLAVSIESDKKAIRILDLKNGKIIKDLYSRSYVSSKKNLFFTKDNKYLISSNAPTFEYAFNQAKKSGKYSNIPRNVIKIWDIKNNFELIKNIPILSKCDFSLENLHVFLKNNKYYAIATNCEVLMLIDLNTGKVINEIKNQRIYKVKYSESNSHVVLIDYKENNNIYNFDFELIKILKNSNCNYSKDGNTYFCDEFPGISYDVENNYSKINNQNDKLNKIDNLAINFSGNELKIINTRNRYNQYKISKKVIKPLIPEIKNILVEKDSIKFEIKNIKQTINFFPISIKKSNHKNIKYIKNKHKPTEIITYSKNKKYFCKYSPLSGRAFFYENNDFSNSPILVGDRDYIVSKNMLWFEDKFIVARYGGNIDIFSYEGVPLYTLSGHNATVNFMSINDNILTTYGEDNIIKLWDLNKLDFNHINYLKFEEKVKEYVKKYKSNRKGTISYLGYYYNHKKANDPIIGISNPMINIFISKDYEYVAWTKDGFFDASKNGAKFIGYHISRNNNRLSKYVGVDKLYDTFYRPDLIQQALKGEDISSYAKGIDINSLLKSGLAPEVKILTSKSYSRERDLNLELEVCTIDDGGYNNLTLYLNNMAVDVIDKNRALKLAKQNRTRKECFTIDKLITLQNGVNKIGFKATNKAGSIESNLDEIVVNYKGRSNSKPNLHIIAIGIDKYRDGDLWLNYSKSDAKEFTKSIKKVSKPLFRNIYTYKLFDKDVTKSKVLDIFKKVGSKTTREDVFMFYMAGHGITDEKTGAYFYLPVDFRYKNENSVREKGLSQNDFKLALSKIQAMKSLVILDTCNSGSFAEAMVSRGVLQKTAITKLTRATGRATIVASSKDQVALEGYKGHGVFTYTLLEALNGKGYGSDNKITIKELAGYIEDILPDRTYNKWGYEQVPQSNISGNDFPIGVK